MSLLLTCWRGQESKANLTDFCLDTGERFIGDRQTPSGRVDIFFAFAALGFLLKSLPLVLDHRLENQKMQFVGSKGMNNDMKC